MYLSEIFFGWQGEGLHAGAPQVFVRTAGCPLRCAYCDTPESLVKTPACAVHLAGEYDEREILTSPNPVTIHWTLLQVERLARRAGGVHSVSITGGEPLAQDHWTGELAGRLKQAGFSTYLETAGIYADRFARIASLFDIVAADVKIPSAAEERPRWKEHAAFLAAALPPRTFVKAVVNSRTSDEEIERAARLVAARSDAIPFFIQPASRSASAAAPDTAQMRRWAAIASAHLRRVHVAGQWHLPKQSAGAPFSAPSVA